MPPQSRCGPVEAVPDLKVLVQRFENALATYWSKDADPNVSMKRLEVLMANVNEKRNDLLAAIKPASEKQAPITDNDRRWRFLEHGCQWVSFTPIGGDTRSFDPRIVSGYAGHLQDMRETVDREAEKHLAILREGINAANR